jgi:hypothetical protein
MISALMRLPDTASIQITAAVVRDGDTRELMHQVLRQSSHVPFQEIGPLDLTHFIAGLVGYSIRPNQPSWSICVELVISAFLPLMWLADIGRLPIFAIIALSAVDLGLQHCWNFYLVNFLAGVAIVCRPLRLDLSKWSWPPFGVLVLIFYFDRPIGAGRGL